MKHLLQGLEMQNPEIAWTSPTNRPANKVKKTASQNCREKTLTICPYLENRSIHLLVVVLFPSVFPRDAEHGFLLILPDEPRVQLAINLLNQPLPEPSPTIAVTHPGWSERSKPR